MSASRPNNSNRTAVMRMYPINTQRASKAEACNVRVIVGRVMRTMFPSSCDMNAPIVVFVRTVYLYSISKNRFAFPDRRKGGLLEIPYKVYFQSSGEF